MRRRWPWTLGVTGGVLLLVALLAAAPFWVARWPAGLHRILDSAGVARVLGGTGGTQRVRIDRVARFSPWGVRLEGVRVENLTPAGWEAWARAGTVELAWRPQSFLARRAFLSRVAVDSLRVDLRKRPQPADSSMAHPAAGPKPNPPWLIEERLMPIRIPELQVTKAVLIDRQGKRREASLDLAGISHRKGRIRATLRGAYFSAVPESLWVTLAGGLVDAQLPRSVAVTALSIEGPGLTARLDGSWTAPASRPAGNAPAPGPGHIAVQLEVRELRPTKVPSARALPLPWHPTDALSGRMDANGTVGGGIPPRVECDLDLVGSVFGTNLDTLLAAGTATSDTADLREIHLRLGTIGMRGSTRWVRTGTSRADLRFRGIDLGSPPISLFADGMPVSDFAGTVHAEADSLGPRLRLLAELELEPGSLLNRPISGLRIRARLDPRELTIEDLRTREDPPALSLAGSLDREASTIALSGMLQGFVLEDWVAPWFGVPLEGKVDGPFRAEGPLSAPKVQAELSARQARVEEVYLDSVRVDPITGTIVPLRLHGEFRAAGLDVYKIPLDSVAGSVLLADTITTRFSAWRDTTRARLAVRVVPQERGAVLFDSLTVNAGRLSPVELAATSRLDWNPNRVGIDSIRFRVGDGRLGGSGWIAPRPNRPGTEPFAFAVDVADFDLGLMASYLGRSPADWAGFATARLEGEGTLRAPVYRFRAEATGLETVDWNWNHLSLAGAAGEGIGLRIDSLRAVSSGFAGPLPGPEPVGPQPPGPAVLLRADSLSVRFAAPWDEVMQALADKSRRQPMLAAARLGGTVAMQRVPAAPFLIPLLGARAWEQRGTTFAESTDPMLAVIRVVHPAVERNGAGRGNALGGSFDLSAKIGGTGRAPEVSVDLLARDLRVLQAWADSLRVRGSYADSLLTLDRLEWHMGTSLFSIQARLPRDIDLSVPTVRSLDRPTQARAELKDADLSLLSLVPAVGRVLQEPSGKLNGWVMVGPEAGPGKLAGRLEVTDGAFRVANREERLRLLHVVARIDSAGAHVEQATGNLGNQGKVEATGLFRSLDNFDVTATVRDGLVYDTGNYRFVADGDFRARPIAEGDTLRPQLSGKVRVLEGLITQDLSKPPPAGAVPARTPWLVDLQVVAPGNFRVNQPQATVDLGEGDLHISFRWPYWNLGGTIQVLSGSYRIFNRSLSITSGTIEFQDTGQGPNPLLDIQAETQIAGQGEEPPIPVVVAVKGYPAKQDLTVTLSSPSHPEYGEAQLIELLSVGQLTAGSFGSFSANDPTRQALSSELLGQVERQLVGQLPWIDRVQLEGQLLGTSPMRINLRPIVQPQWSLIYSQDLAASPDRELAVRYRLSNLFFLNAAADRRRSEQGLTNTYSLDLKIRFEY
jgi:autotransporter translocation and assembly factor TamB